MAAPKGLTLTPATEALEARWSVTSSKGLVGFRIRWRALTTPASPWSRALQLPAGTRRHKITGLRAIPYEVSVRALMSGGKQGGSLTAVATPLAAEQPGGGEEGEKPSGETWTSVGAAPLTDSEAAALVKPAPEQRPANAAANDYVPSTKQLEAFYAAKNNYGETVVQWNPLDRYVTGRPGLADPTTDELIQWAAYKWGIPVNWLRAQYVEESDWYQLSGFEKGLGDEATVSAEWYSEYPPAAKIAPDRVYQSMGIAQVKWKPDGSVGAGTEPLRWESTAFNMDYEAAGVRYYYDGYCKWCTAGYAAGQEWNSIGAWEEPTPWGNSLQTQYIKTVQRILAEKPWLSPSF